jgi:hypothetical protein
MAVNPGEELVEAAENLLKFGGSVTRRAGLRQALDRLPYAADERQDITRHWNFTPPALGVLARAASLALDEEDRHIRIKHLEQALKETPV